MTNDYEFPEGTKLYFVNARPHPKKHFNRAGLRFDEGWRPILLGATTDLKAPIPIVSPEDFARIERDSMPQLFEAGVAPPMLTMAGESEMLGKAQALEYLASASLPVNEVEMLRRTNAEQLKTIAAFEARLIALELSRPPEKKAKP